MSDLLCRSTRLEAGALSSCRTGLLHILLGNILGELSWTCMSVVKKIVDVLHKPMHVHAAQVLLSTCAQSSHQARVGLLCLDRDPCSAQRQAGAFYSSQVTSRAYRIVNFICSVYSRNPPGYSYNTCTASPLSRGHPSSNVFILSFQPHTSLEHGHKRHHGAAPAHLSLSH